MRILTYGYDAGVVGREVSQGTIRNHSRNLIGSLGHLRHKSPVRGSSQASWVESLGH